MQENPNPAAGCRTVAEVTRIALDWVNKYCGTLEHFAGAYMFGGIVHLPDDAPFPAYRDVDLILVVAQETPPFEENLEVLHDGVMFEIGYEFLDRLALPETILADPWVATNFAFTRILSDPLGRLSLLQQVVRRDFARRQWVQARCDREMREVQENIVRITSKDNFFEKSLAVWSTCNGLTGLLALACLCPPTHRRSLAVGKEILETHGRSDIHMQVLHLWGSDALTRAAVEELLVGAMEVFDRAVAIHKSPVPFGFKLHAHLRPYFLDASLEMIEEGLHREATFWIGLPVTLGYLVAAQDGSSADQERASEQHARFFAAHRMSSLKEIAGRVVEARQLADVVGDFAAERIAQYA